MAGSSGRSDGEKERRTKYRFAECPSKVAEFARIQMVAMSCRL
jgi:hypothetical protein